MRIVYEVESAAYANGVTDGESARDLGHPITIYLEVGIDDYAKGFRAGFFRDPDSRNGKRPKERLKDVGGR